MCLRLSPLAKGEGLKYNYVVKIYSTIAKEAQSDARIFGLGAWNFSPDIYAN